MCFKEFVLRLKFIQSVSFTVNACIFYCLNFLKLIIIFSPNEKISNCCSVCVASHAWNLVLTTDGEMQLTPIRKKESSLPTSNN